MTVTQLAKRFANAAEQDMIHMSNYLLVAVDQVRILPIYYHGGKTCIALKQNRGQSLLYFFGGSIGYSTPWEALFLIAVEELGIEFNYNDFKKSLLEMHIVNRTLTVMVNITGISEVDFNHMYMWRMGQGNYPDGYIKIDHIKCVPINIIRLRYDLSREVTEQVAELERWARVNDTKPSWTCGSGIDVADFNNTGILNRILNMLR